MRGAVLLTGWAAALLAVGAAGAAESTLAEALRKAEKIPPDWLAGVPITYDTAKPWKDARIHIRQLLSQGKNREAIRLTYDYLVERKVQPDTHEYAMYLYLGGESEWALRIYRERLKPLPKGVTNEYQSLASLYERFGESDLAIKTLRDALGRLPDPPWAVTSEAGLHAALGDMYAHMGNTEKAVEHYRIAMDLYPKSNQPYGRHLLPRNVAKVQAKLDLLLRKSLDLTRLRDGVYQGRGLGYVEDVAATVTLQGGRITDIRIAHKEKIEQGATQSVPKQIIARQSLQVDAITGATVTTQAIVEAVYRALQKAGL
jgi:uncharacterized protein with FMN-binding domain